MKIRDREGKGARESLRERDRENARVCVGV